jgi:regulator of RNase E activity RraA
MLHLIEQLEEFEAALIAEGMAAMGCTNPEDLYLGRDVRLLTRQEGLVAGTAVTLEADTSTPGKAWDISGYQECLRQVHEMVEPVILVVKTIGSRAEHECVCGDGWCKMSYSVGCVGLVTDGAVRDLERIHNTGLAVFANGTVTNHCALVFRRSQGPVTISGVTISDGDLIVGDRDGVMKVPAAYHQGIVEACLLTRDFESRAHTFLRRTDKTPAEKEEYVSDLAKIRDGRCRELYRSG